MPRVWLACIIVVSLGVAVALSIGAARETTGETWQAAPTQTPWVREIVRYVDVLITPEPSPIPTVEPEPTATRHPHRATTGVLQIDMPPRGNPARTRLGGE